MTDDEFMDWALGLLKEIYVHGESIKTREETRNWFLKYQGIDLLEI